jgi:hypothetical protein
MLDDGGLMTDVVRSWKTEVSSFDLTSIDNKSFNSTKIKNREKEKENQKYKEINKRIFYR